MLSQDMTHASPYVTPAIQYKVVVNHEEQYALWIDGRENAPGWRDAGCRGQKEDCLDFVRRHWTDMRPLSLRKSLRDQSGAMPCHSKAFDTSPELVG
jgi:MbtH protein